ncbi:isatin hydrolase-like [Ruditapes philippinarum]|uniref:isatin hydrolase-like n=1 Tax=Ruditapes philippinarum TaxID=129788 RepID=UPI00295B6370|nr:isatin hydrolase-like [Ruditapes philippinarum]
MKATMGGAVLFLLLALPGGIYGRKMIDLTHTFDKDAPKYPLTWLGAENFTYYRLTPLLKRYYDDMWVELNQIEFYEHQGTHIDAPIHFGNGRQSLEQIPPEKLIGPGVVIDVQDKVRNNADYAVTVEDIKMHEAEYGRIPPNAIITFNSGWSRKYPNSTLIFGTKNLTDPNTFHFPGWSLEACEFLLQQRQVSVVGSDTPSTDPGNPPGYPCHMYLQPNNVPLLEYIANLDRIPARGTTFVLGVMKVRGGSGGPTRIFALLDDDEDDIFNSAEGIRKSLWMLFVAVVIRHFS